MRGALLAHENSKKEKKKLTKPNKDSSLLPCDAVSLGEQFPTFRMPQESSLHFLLRDSRSP